MLYGEDISEVQGGILNTVSRFNFDMYRPSNASTLPEAKLEPEKSIL